MMIEEINVQFNKQVLSKHIENKLDQAIQSQLWLVDAERIAELTCMSKRYLEEEVFIDPRMKAIEIKKARKRWWPANQAYEVIKEITSEW